MYLMNVQNVREAFRTANEVTEHMRVITYSGAYELVEVNHQDYHKWFLCAYIIEQGDDLTTYRFDVNKMSACEVFGDEVSARLRLVSTLTIMRN